MKFLHLIEEKINALLELIFVFIKNQFSKLWQLICSKIIPPKFFEILNTINNRIRYIKLKIIDFKNICFENIKKIFFLLKSKIANIKELKTKLLVFISLTIEKLRTKKKEPEKKQTIKERWAKLQIFIHYLWENFFQWLTRVQPTFVIAVFITIISGSIAVKYIMSLTKSIYHKSVGKRAPAQVEEVEIIKRPVYYKIDKKMLFLVNVYVPVYASDTNKYQTLSMDIQIQTSTRLLKEFLFKNQNMIRDQLTLKIEPVVPEFPLTQEGRVMLKEKIQRELNLFLKEQQVEGEIENVIITNIFTS